MAANARIKDLAPGAVFDIGPSKAVILEHFPNGKTLLATAEPIGNRPFTVRPFTYNRADPEPAANNFVYSTLRFDLNDDFLSTLDDAGVIPMNRISDTTWDLSDHDGGNRYGAATCKIGLLSEAQVRKYYDTGLLEIDDWEWTLTPYAGRQYGEDGYGDEYLVLLTADTVREMAFSEYTMIRSAEIMAARAAAQEGGDST